MRKRKHKYSHIPVRLNLLFSMIVVLFGLLVFRLVDLQVVNSENFQSKLTQTRVIQIKQDVERGQILDRNGVVLAGNQTYTTINYTRTTTDVNQMITLAQKIAPLIQVDSSHLKERDLQDFFVAKNIDVVNERLNHTEKTLTGSTLYQTQVSKVTADDIQYSDEEKEIIAIFTKMNSVSWLNTVMIKNRDVTNEEVANITDKLSELEGVSIGRDWERTYPQGTLLRDLLGQVTSSEAGIPLTESNQYLAKGYSLNSRIGNSYLEKQYDDVLRGTPSVKTIQLDAKYQIEEQKVTYQGKSGDNVYLTIDSNFQKKVDNILTAFLKNRNVEGLGDLNYSAYAVVQKVNTGEILALSGKKLGYNSETDSYTETIEDDILGAVNNTFTPGSTVKAATVGLGYEYGLITEDNNTIQDKAIYFGNYNVPISSVFNRNGEVDVNDEMALARSSNVYMVRLAMGIGGQTEFTNGDQLNIKPDTLSMLRKSYAMYGLGGSTGIDLPNASRGYYPNNDSARNALFLSFGQYDSYSPLQLSQYISTIANGGTRYALRLAKEIRQMNGVDTLGKVQTTIDPKVMNTINITKGQMERIQKGLYAVTHNPYGTSSDMFRNFYPQVSSKTGTAEAFYGGVIKSKQGKPVENSLEVAYFPSNAPDVSVTVVIPYVERNKGISGRLVKEIISAYHVR